MAARCSCRGRLHDSGACWCEGQRRSGWRGRRAVDGGAARSGSQGAGHAGEGGSRGTDAGAGAGKGVGVVGAWARRRVVLGVRSLCCRTGVQRFMARQRGSGSGVGGGGGLSNKHTQVSPETTEITSGGATCKRRSSRPGAGV